MATTETIRALSAAVVDADGGTNLLAETLRDMAMADKSPADVQWVGSRDGKYAMQWGEFAELAKATIYDSGFGGQEIAPDLVVVGADWWLERHEYNGSEWWEFKRLPKWGAEPPLAFAKVRSRYGQTLEAAQQAEED